MRKLSGSGDNQSDLTDGMEVTSDAAEGSRNQTRSQMDRSQTRIPPKRVGNYEILRLIGQGGMGAVFLARHLKLDKEVALKLIRSRAKANGLAEARFDRELRAVGKLDHPNIVRALDAGEFNGTTFLSMELLQGLDLDQVNDGDGSLATADACEVVRQAAIGLQYIHSQGLVHRDIKPSNLMLCKDPVAQVRVKVMDLGLAFILGDADDERLTGEGVAIGTYRYMSLEQSRNTHSVDHRADIYSLGATLYRLLVGEPPFSRDEFETQAQLLMALMSGHVPDVTAKLPELPEPIATIITRMLASDPDQRPNDMDEVIEVLSPFAKSHQLAALLKREMRRFEKKQVATQGDHSVNLIDNLLNETTGTSDRSIGSLDSDTDEIGILRQRVRRFWVDGVLGRTKDNTQLFSLNRMIADECVRSPWEGITQSPLHSIDSNAPIDQLFEHAERSLLILGDAGAGKSTTLLELTEYLLRLSEKSRREPVPVMLHLSSWNRRSGSFDQWVVQELNAKYQIPKAIGREFIEKRRIIVLLDGLDEIRPAEQPACVRSVNEFLSQMTPPGVVVCSRYTEYMATDVKFQMQGAVRLQPLTSDQIMASISGSTGTRQPLVNALAKHQALLELASSPLMLSMMKTSFDDSGADSIESFETIENARQHLFDTFVTEAFRSKSRSTKEYSKQETVGWLSWIAQQMQDRNQTVFLMGELQPDWFGSLSQRLSYLLTLSLSLGAISGLATMYFWYQQMPIMDTSSSTPYSSLFWLLLQLPVWWAQLCFLDLFVFPSRVPRSFFGRAGYGIGKTIVYLFLWMLWPIIGSMTGVWTTGWTVANILLGILTAASIGILGRRKRVTVDVDVAQPLGFSLPGMVRGWASGYLVGFVVYSTYVCLWSLYLLDEPPDWFPYFWNNEEERCVSIAWPLAFSSVGLVAGGLVPQMSHGRSAPDQGVPIYLRNTMITGAFSLVSVFATGMLVLTYWLNLPSNPLEFSWAQRAILLSGGVLWSSFYMALCFGGLDLLCHGLTRLILKTDGVIPSQLSKFLKHSTKLGLLRRVGGAHIFSHRMLLEYFADKSQAKSASSSDSV